MHSRSAAPEHLWQDGRWLAVRRFLLAAALLYAAFVVYGSLVPLQFQAMPFDEALTRFRALRWPHGESAESTGWLATILLAPLAFALLGALWHRGSAWRALSTVGLLLAGMLVFGLGIGSPADWVTNILLFVPFAFLWLGVLWSRESMIAQLAASMLVLAGAVAFSLGIEFCQLFFPPRVSSLNDVSAQIIGTLLGIGTWWLWGESGAAWAVGWLDEHDRTSLPTRLLTLYVGGLFAYGVLPLDLTLSPVEIYHKFREGRVVLVPFSGLPADTTQFIYELVSDVAIWIPAGLLWRIAGLTTAQVVWRTALAAALLELLQLLVYSRVSDVTDVITALAGGWIGALMVMGFPAAAKAHGAGLSTPGALPGARALAALAWCAVLLVVFWYPFDFQSDPAFLRMRIERLQQAPFSAYFHSTEFRAMTALLQHVLFFVPLGLLLGRALPQRRPSAQFWAIIAVAAGVVVAVIEAGRLMLPTKFPDIADWVITWLAALVGAWVVRRMEPPSHSPREPARRVASSDARPPAMQPRSAWRSPASQVGTRYWNWRLGLLGALVAAGMIWLVTLLPTAPYNVRELLAPGKPMLRVLMLALSLLLIGAYAGVAEQSLRGSRPITALWRWPALLAAFALTAAVLLMQAVTGESVADVVGSPVLGWPLRTEQWLRLSVLMGLVMWMLLGGLLFGRRKEGAGRAAWVLISLWLLPFCYWVIVLQAATDNLTELLAGDASPLAAAAAAMTVLVAGAAGTLVVESGRRRGLRGWALAVVVFPLTIGIGYWLAMLASEATIVKYGRVFSGLQFLLGTDREHLPGPRELLLRFSAAYGALLVFSIWMAVQVPGPRSVDERTL